MLKVVHDNDGPSGTAERCCICTTPTRYWYVKNDVALCMACAHVKEDKDIPSKRDWLVANGAKLPEGWKCAADLKKEAA